MNHFKLFATLGTTMIVAAIAQGQSLYWDINGATAGGGTAGNADGIWDAATTTNWTTDSAGTSATSAYTAGSDVVFSAGSDVTTANITVSGTQTVSSVTVEEGSIAISGSAIDDIGSNILISVASGASLSLNNDGPYNADFNIEGTFYANTIRGGSTMAKSGAGTATFDRMDAYLTINDGKVIYTGLNGAKIKSATINSGATFEITGNTFDGTGRSVAVNTGGTFEMGAGVSQTIGSLSGAGSIIGNTGSALTVGGTRTFNGDISGELNLNTTGTLTLSDTSSMEFTIDGDGINNSLSGTGAMNLNGDFNFNLTSADLTAGNSWQIVDIGSISSIYGATFSVVDFTNDSGVWTNNSNSDLIFSQTSGALTVIPEPSTLSLILGFAGLAFLTLRKRS